MLADRASSAVFVIDVQEAFRAHIPAFGSMVATIRLLVQGARALGIPVGWSEQYPRGLGRTVPELLDVLEPSEYTGSSFDKLEISSFDAPGWAGLPPVIRDAEQLIIVGIETHVCVRQTVLGLLADGRSVQIAVDAVESRGAQECTLSLRSLERAGAQLVTVEQVLFDWLEVAGTTEFRVVQELIKIHGA